MKSTPENYGCEVKSEEVKKTKIDSSNEDRKGGMIMNDL